MRPGTKFCHNSSVRRFAIFLLVLLPLQFAFAAAAPYCALEKAQVSAHFGHHQHSDSSTPEPTTDDGQGSAKVDDCGICHLGSAQAHFAVASAPALPQAKRGLVLPDKREPQHLQEPTERPPRPSLA